MLKRFDPALSSEQWDAVFIGSGPGSLTAAAILARAGRRVLVLERHYEPGGFSHTFKRKGFEWDVGVHYIGVVHKERGVERRIFDYISKGRIQWAPMGDPYDRAIIDGEVYDFVSGPDRQLELWINHFPKDEVAIRKYWELIRDCARQAGPFFGQKALPAPFGSIMKPFMSRKFMSYARRTTYDVLRELTNNETLITVLCAQCGDYGLPPRDSSFAIHAMVVNHYRDGGNYPTGGASRIADGIIDTIVANGGVVSVRAPIGKIVVEKGVAVGVALESGDVVRAERVVSGVGVRNTFERLLPDSIPTPPAIARDLERTKPSYGHCCLYLGLDSSAEALRLPKYNYWCYDPWTGAKADGARIPAAYISFPSAKDPEWRAKHGDTATVQCIGFGGFDDFAQWADSPWRRRGDDYEAAKDVFQNQMLGILSGLHPNVRQHVAWAEVSTPLSTAHFAGYPRGEIYGLEHTPARFALNWLRPRTFLPGLWLTGQDIVTCGVGGALMSGVVTASAILGKNMVTEIMRG